MNNSVDVYQIDAGELDKVTGGTAICYFEERKLLGSSTITTKPVANVGAVSVTTPEVTYTFIRCHGGRPV